MPYGSERTYSERYGTAYNEPKSAKTRKKIIARKRKRVKRIKPYPYHKKRIERP